MAGSCEHRQRDRSDVAQIHRANPGVIASGIELSLRCDRVFETQINLHELIWLQMSERKAGILDFLFRFCVPPQEPPFRVNIGVHSGELHNVTDSGAFGCSNEVSLKFREPWIDGGYQKGPVYPLQRWRQRVRVGEVAIN